MIEKRQLLVRTPNVSYNSADSLAGLDHLGDEEIEELVASKVTDVYFVSFLAISVCHQILIRVSDCAYKKNLPSPK